jgi:hypothetical protein
VGDRQMNDTTPVTPHPSDLTGPGVAVQSDRASLAATGWSPVGPEPRRAKPPTKDQRAAIADLSPGRGTVPGPSVSVALLGVLILMAWFVLAYRPLPSMVAAPASTEPAVVSVVHCSPGSWGLVTALQKGMTDPEAGPLRYVGVVKSRAYARLYFVAATIAGTGWSARVGLWATDDPSGDGRIYSVNGNAIADSTWPDGGVIDLHLSELDDGADVAMACGDG